MELKQRYVQIAVGAFTRFNRTFMELKHVVAKTTLQARHVLIGPSWN